MNCTTHKIFRLVLLILGLQVSSWAQTLRIEDVYVLGPIRFTASQRGPQTQSISFSIGPETRGPFKLTLVNGGSTAGNRDGTGVTRVSAARIGLNGEQLFGPSDFNQNVATLEREVSLNEQNELQVTVASAPTGVITVMISGKREVVGTSTQRFEWIRVDSAVLQVNQATAVTVTAQVAVDPTLLPESVRLLRYNDQNQQIADLGQMYDDGTHGDTLKGDNIFSATVSFNETQPVAIFFKASASYRDLTAAVTSEAARVVVQAPISPEQTLLDLATDLTSGNITAALNRFTPSEKTTKALNTFNKRQLDTLAALLRSAYLVSEAADVRVYRAVWSDGGITSEVEFGLARNTFGDWVIFSW